MELIVQKFLSLNAIVPETHKFHSSIAIPFNSYVNPMEELIVLLGQFDFQLERVPKWLDSWGTAMTLWTPEKVCVGLTSGKRLHHDAKSPC